MAKKFIVTGVEDLGNNQYTITGYTEEGLDLDNGDVVSGDGNDDGGIEVPKKPPPPEP